MSVALGGVLSLPIAFGRMSKIPLFNRLAFGYIYFFRGTPLLAQLFLLYYGFGQFRHFWQDLNMWWLFRDSWVDSAVVLHAEHRSLSGGNSARGHHERAKGPD